jgi:hypothetical protein
MSKHLTATLLVPAAPPGALLLVGILAFSGCSRGTGAFRSADGTPPARLKHKADRSVHKVKKPGRIRASRRTGRPVAQRIAWLYLDRPYGPIIGRVYPGTPVSVKETKEQWLLIRVGRYERQAWFYENKRRAGVTTNPLTAWARRDAFAHRAVRKSRPPSDGIRVRDFQVDLSHTPKNTVAEAAGNRQLPFAETLCGPMRVLRQKFGRGNRPIHSLVAQYRNGFEVMGWADYPIDSMQGDHRCPARVVFERTGQQLGRQPVVPKGFVRSAGRSAHLALKNLISAGRSVYWIEEKRKSYNCRRWRFAPNPPGPSSGRLTLRMNKPSRHNEVWFGYILRPDRTLTLFGPNSRSVREEGAVSVVSTTSALCAVSMTAVELRPGRITMLSNLSSGKRVSAYHPDDGQTWYLNRKACLGAASNLDAKFGDAKRILLGQKKVRRPRRTSLAVLPPPKPGGC